MSSLSSKNAGRIPINGYKKNKYSIGDIVLIDDSEYVIKQIYDKGIYNMYFCRDKLKGLPTTITDKD